MKLRASEIEAVLPSPRAEDILSIMIGGQTYLTNLTIDQFHDRTGRTMLLVKAGTERETEVLINPRKIICVMPSDTKYTSVSTVGGTWIDVVTYP